MDKKKKQILIDEIEVFIFDFDGVLTNNIVHIDSNGMEYVSCSRADGLAFDVIHKLKNTARGCPASRLKLSQRHQPRLIRHPWQ